MRHAIAGVLCSVCAVSAALGDWNPGDPHKMHYPQLPDLSPTGMDVLDSISLSAGATVDKWLADDWRCGGSGPVTDVHIWGSWLDDQIPHSPVPGAHGTFQLAIYSDIPAGPTGQFSRPGNLLWSKDFLPGAYVGRPYATAPEQFYDPNLNQIIGTDTQVWQYNFFINPSEAFVQQQGTIYWLAVHNYDPDGNGVIDTADLITRFGWKTSLNHFNDDAVFVDNGDPFGTIGPKLPPLGGWHEMIYPSAHPLGGQSIDLSFVITPEPASLAGMLLAMTALRRRR